MEMDLELPVPLPEGFNVHTQDITLLYPDGTPLSIPLSEINILQRESIRLVTVMASQIGAAAILLILLAILTRPEKRFAPIFLSNMAALLFVVLRSVFQILYFTGPWYDFFAYHAFFFDDIPRSAYATSITTTVLAQCLHIAIMVSLILQVRVVYASNPRLNKIMTIASIVVALNSVGWFTAVTVQISRSTMNREAYFSPWVYPTSRAVLAGSIVFFSAIFVAKLGWAIKQRRILGLDRWGPLQCIFVMGCQTLFVPGKTPPPIKQKIEN